MKSNAQPIRDLDAMLSRSQILRLLDAGRQSDINQGGYCDARSGVINLWCGPEDKPACWTAPIDQGDLDYPREFVGMLSWKWTEDLSQARLIVEAEPYAMLDARRGAGLTEPEWEQCLNWCEAKARALIALADEMLDVVGTHCPFCDFILSEGQLINGLIDHIQERHPGHKIESLTAGAGLTITTREDSFPLLPATRAPAE
jgi:hypothetical protein